MKLTFFGAAKAVTGSCHCVEVRGKKILIDCGLQQGRDERDNAVFDFSPNYIDYVIVTHAHIDHSGRIPLLIKEGFQGQIFYHTSHRPAAVGDASGLGPHSGAGCPVEKPKGKAGGPAPGGAPLYCGRCGPSGRAFGHRGVWTDHRTSSEGVKIRFVDAGHLLGSASVEMWMRGGRTWRRRSSSPATSATSTSRSSGTLPGSMEADYVVMESTYGDRNHAPVAVLGSGAGQDHRRHALPRGGNVVIPSFAVGRTQELLYFMREIKKEGLVKTQPRLPPSAWTPPWPTRPPRSSPGTCGATWTRRPWRWCRKGSACSPSPACTDDREQRGVQGRSTLDKSSKVIISASGMCDAGRIRHHLKHNLWREECAIVFVGYQGEGTLGRHLLEGAKQVRLFGEEIAVNASIYNFQGLSSHADRDHLLQWIDQVKDPAPQQIFVVHGDAQVTEIFANTLREKGLPAHAPLYEEVFDLARNVMLAAGVEIAPKKTSFASTGRPSTAYHELELAAMDLLSIIRASKGGANKDLKKMAAQLRAVTEKWKDA